MGFFFKGANHKKVEKYVGTNLKKRDWYYSKVSKHAKNYKLFTSHSDEYVVAQVANGVVGEKAQRIMQFAIMLHLLQ